MARSRGSRPTATRAPDLAAADGGYFVLPWLTTSTSQCTSPTLPVASDALPFHTTWLPTPTVLAIVIFGPLSVTLHDLVVSICFPALLTLKHW